MFNENDLVEFVEGHPLSQQFGNRYRIIRFDESEGMYMMGPAMGFEVLIYGKPEEIRKVE